MTMFFWLSLNLGLRMHCPALHCTSGAQNKFSPRRRRILYLPKVFPKLVHSLIVRPRMTNDLFLRKEFQFYS